jgi:hypothetical protein
MNVVRPSSLRDLRDELRVCVVKRRGSLLDLAVADGDGTVRRACGDLGLVRDEDDGVAGVVQPLEERHDLDAGLRVEVAGRLVGQQDRRVVDQRARDGDALALAARQLVGPVASCGPSSTFSSAAFARSCRSRAGTPA